MTADEYGDSDDEWTDTQESSADNLDGFRLEEVMKIQ